MKRIAKALGQFKEISPEEMQSAGAQALRSLGVQNGERILVERPSAETARRDRRSPWPAVAVIAAAIAVAVLVPPRIVQSAPGTLEDASGSRKIQFGEIVRPSGDKSATLSMADGSRVEARPQSEFSLERAEDGGTRIRLNRGSVAVVAAVSEVRVQQGTTETRLRTGEQVTSSAAPSIPPKERIAFEVATIRPAAVPPPRAGNARGPGGGVLNSRPGPDGCTVGSAGYSLQVDPRRFATTRTTLLQIVALAYPDALDGQSAFSNCQSRSKLGFLSGGPEWVKTEMWDVQATIPEGVFPALPSQQLSSDPKLKQMLQTLLEERFKLVMRRETREMPTYLLKVGKDGPKFNGRPPDLVFVTGDTPIPSFNEVPPGTRGIYKLPPDGGFSMMFGGRIVDGVRISNIVGVDLSMADIAGGLTGATGRVVIDQTGLKGTYSYHAELADDGVQSTLRKAMEGFGFRFEESRAAMEVWVIDRAEKPSEN